MKKFLVIQTAFIGDAILASALLEKLHRYYPEAQTDFVLRKGNEGLFKNHPFLNEVIIWDKKEGKFRNLFRVVKKLRKTKYDYLINLQRFASSGIISCFAKAETKIGFDKNPLSFCYDVKIDHHIGNGMHEIERNQKTIESITDSNAAKPSLYPTSQDVDFIADLLKKHDVSNQKYYCLAPASVWFTKQFPEEKWVELIHKLDMNPVFLLGAPGDNELCERINKKAGNKCFNLAGKLSLLQSAELMKNATMNYVNDSAPMHLASAMNASVTAIFCSTVPEFGFGPLSDNSRIVQTSEKLSCRPCGLHGFKSCPEGHFKCGNGINSLEFRGI